MRRFQLEIENVELIFTCVALFYFTICADTPRTQIQILSFSTRAWSPIHDFFNNRHYNHIQCKDSDSDYSLDLENFPIISFVMFFGEPIW